MKYFTRTYRIQNQAMIRLASIKDAIQINRLSQSLGYSTVSDNLASDRLLRALKSENDRIWVADSGNELSGWIHAFIAYRIASSSFVEIGGIAVDPQLHNQGIGRQLVAEAKQWASAQALSLRVRCNSQRKPAHEFYQAVGFEQIKEQFIFDCND